MSFTKEHVSENYKFFPQLKVQSSLIYPLNVSFTKECLFSEVELASGGCFAHLKNGSKSVFQNLLKFCL